MNALAGIADVYAATGRMTSSARLRAATDSLRAQIDAGVEAWQQARHQRSLDLARGALPAEAFEAAWAEGASLSIEAIIAQELAAAEPSEVVATAGNPDAPDDATDFTPRERDVLRLLAAGRTDRDIAAELSISPRTVGGHVTSILGKLGVESRTSAAAFAVRHGLD
jgi:DNA-binding CsgD family transcriptional regulator